MSKSIIKRIVWVYVTILLGASLSMAEELQKWDYQDARLENGLRVITLADHRTPLANAQVWYHVGSKNEDPQRQGFAHMFEHMMFRGTDRIGPQDHFKYLQRYGGLVNGYTSFDMTVYWETVPASQLDLALWLEAERMAHLKINEDYFFAEREVVKEEYRMRYLNRPYGKLYDTLFSAAFKVHPYQWTPIGNMEHLNAATTDELRAFFKKYYVPNNATLVVVGDVEHEDVVARAQKYFGKIPRSADPERVTLAEPAMTEARRVEIKDVAPSPRIVFAYPCPSDRDPDGIPLAVLRRIMSTGQSSRLYRQLVQGKKIAVNAFGAEYLLEQAGLFVLSVTLKPDVRVEEGERALLDEIGTLLSEGVEPAELEKAKNQAVAEYVREGETVQGRASQLGYAAVILDDVNRVNTDLERTRKLTREEVMAVAKRVFRDDNRITVVVRPDENPQAPEEVEDKSSQASEEIAELPPPDDMPIGHPPQPMDVPVPSCRTLANGLRVIVFTDHATPAVTVSLNMLVGAKDDPRDKPGMAFVTVNTLRRGTEKHSGDALAELIDFHAMTVSESVDHSDTEIGMWTLTEHLSLATETLAEIVREPVFPEQEVAGFTSRAAAREAIEEKNLSTVATRLFQGVIFGEHYLARPAEGTSASLNGLTRDDVVAFHQKYFAPDVAGLVFAGDVDADRAFALADRWFGDWQAKAEKTTSPPPPASVPLHIVVADRNQSLQSEIRIGQVVPVTRHDPDYAAVRMLSHLFGETFSGRLNRSLRIEKGLTYGARGYFDVKAEAAAFTISTFTRTEKADDAIRAALEEVDRLRVSEVTAEEMQESRDAMIGRFQMALETPAQMADLYWNLIVWHLPNGWYTQYLKSISQLTDPAILQRVAQVKLAPSKLAIVVVGNAQELKPDLEKIAPVNVQAEN